MGANLEVRGQSVNAINYPSANVIVLDEKACDQLELGNESGYVLLVHEYLGLAGIDDRIYQISRTFAKKTLENTTDVCWRNDSKACMNLWVKLKHLRKNLAELENKMIAENVGTSTKNALLIAQRQKALSRVKIIDNGSEKIDRMMAKIKTLEDDAKAECGGWGCNSGIENMEKAAQIRIEVAAIYRGEIAKLIVKISDSQ